MSMNRCLINDNKGGMGSEIRTMRHSDSHNAPVELLLRYS